MPCRRLIVVINKTAKHPSHSIEIRQQQREEFPRDNSKPDDESLACAFLFPSHDLFPFPIIPLNVVYVHPLRPEHFHSALTIFNIYFEISHGMWLAAIRIELNKCRQSDDVNQKRLWQRHPPPCAIQELAISGNRVAVFHKISPLGDRSTNGSRQWCNPSRCCCCWKQNTGNSLVQDGEQFLPPK